MKAPRLTEAQKASVLRRRRHAGRGDLPQGRDQAGDLLQLEEEVWQQLPDEVRRLQALAGESARLKKIAANLGLGQSTLVLAVLKAQARE